MSGILDIFGNSSPTPYSDIFTVFKKPTQTIDQILKGQQYNNTKNNYISNIASRIQALANGQLTPKASWEKVVGYAAQTGKPLSISFDSKNQPQADVQLASDFMQMNVLKDIDTISQKLQANQKNTKMLNELSNSEFTISSVASGLIQPTADWQTQGAALLNAGKPFNTYLDTNGNIAVQDQLLDPMTNLDAGSQKILRHAVATIPSIISNQTYTQSWQVDAYEFNKQKTPYHLNIDPITKQISAVENSAANIVPSFLKDPPYPDLKLDTQWKKDAASMIKSGKAFTVDFTNNKTSVKEINAKNLINILNPNVNKGLGSVLDYLA